MAEINAVPGPGWLPTFEMVNSDDPEIRASQVQNLREWMVWASSFLERIVESGNVLELGNSVAAETSYGLVPGAGSSVLASRTDHTHGSPSLSSAAPSDVASANASGSGAQPSRYDHQHRGVRSLSANSGTNLFGDIELVDGTGITITQSGQNITVTASTTGWVTYIWAPTAAAAVGVITSNTFTSMTFPLIHSGRMAS